MYRSCLHTTLASLLSHELGHTEPQTPPKHTSTLPSYFVSPPINLISPLVQLSFEFGAVSIKYLYYINQIT